MISFNLYYLVFGIAGFIIAVYTTRWIFKIDEMNDNIKEQTVILKKILVTKNLKKTINFCFFCSAFVVIFILN